tara:strand:- start:67 stop:978 length:912 start_codon:yes stop_codon:yes gene_type:complete
MKILLTGSMGQLGQEVVNLKPNNCYLKALTKEELDLNNLDECYQYVIDFKPDWLINCAAYTDVERAETNSEKVFQINSYAPKYFAKALAETGGKMIQISTDYVFDGEKGSPYHPKDKVNPLNVYGESKAMAENFLEDYLKTQNQLIILRTSWILSSKGKNFLKTMIKLLPNKKSISVVKDQYGCITGAKSLAKICWALIMRCSKPSNNTILPSKLHWCESGTISWFDLASSIQDFVFQNEIFGSVAEIIPILTSEYGSKVKRPKYSVLNCIETEEFLKIKQIGWKKSINEILLDIFGDCNEDK